ncbi:hypothetical protein [Bradyrhizobium sp. 14AA]
MPKATTAACPHEGGRGPASDRCHWSGLKRCAGGRLVHRWPAKRSASSYSGDRERGGAHAPQTAAGALGAAVTILGRSIAQLRELDELSEGRVRARFLTLDVVEDELPSAHLVIGPVLVQERERRSSSPGGC